MMDTMRETMFFRTYFFEREKRKMRGRGGGGFYAIKPAIGEGVFDFEEVSGGGDNNRSAGSCFYEFSC